jgi:dTDP-4-dehydrorhamnose reductase
MTTLVTGGEGQLGRHLARLPDVVALGRHTLDICDPDSVARTLDHHRPTRVVHCAARTNVDACEQNPPEAFRVNAGGTEVVAAACAARGIPLLHVSTDYVLGAATPRLSVHAPYDSRSAYARSKQAAEQAVRALGGTIIRVQWVYHLTGTSFVNRAIAEMRAGRSVPLVTDQVGCPTPAPHLARWLWELATLPQLPAVLHLATTGEATPAQWVCALARAAGVEPRWHPISRTDLRGAYRPARSCLDVRDTQPLLSATLPTWSQALEELTAAATGPTTSERSTHRR